MKRLALVGASLVLVGGMTAACGSSPEDASKDDFCSAMEKFISSEDEDSFKDNRDELKDVGTPKEIDGDARKGFEFMVDIDWDDRNETPDDDDVADVTAFMTKYSEVCMGDIQSDLEDQLGDMEDELPSTEGTE